MEISTAALQHTYVLLAYSSKIMYKFHIQVDKHSS